jgi:hypothetical protein
LGCGLLRHQAERSYHDKVKLAILASCLILISLLIASFAFESMFARTVPLEELSSDPGDLLNSHPAVRDEAH